VQKAITYVGHDVHKDSIVVSLAEAGLRGSLRELREYGKVPNTPAALKAMAIKLAAGGSELRFCYRPGLAAMASSDSSVRWDVNRLRTLTLHRRAIETPLCWLVPARSSIACSGVSMICQGMPLASCFPVSRPLRSQSNMICGVMPIAAAAPCTE
jgi:hypothetical protein